MKKYVLGLFCFLYAGLFLSAQIYFSEETIRGEHYEITVMSPGDLSGRILARELELRFDFYNRLFRFDTRILEAPLKVRLFSDPKAYNDYVASRLGSYRPGAVYLHYNRSDMRELVINRGSRDEESILPGQVFMQFLRGFITNPPAWLREGFAIYFNNLRFVSPGRSLEGDDGSLTYEENLVWLDTVKRLGRNAPPIRDILQSGPRESSETFQICSWALVSFLLNSGNSDYYRALSETFMILSHDATVEENTLDVMRRFTLWTDLNAMSGDYFTYLNSRKTFMELVEDGRRAYTIKDTKGAKEAFQNALNLQKENHAPYYYLGPLAFEDKDYEKADTCYLSALQYGAEQALISYARGINAAAAGKNAEAIRFLEQAAVVSPSRYKARTDELIRQLR